MFLSQAPRNAQSNLLATLSRFLPFGRGMQVVLGAILITTMVAGGTQGLAQTIKPLDVEMDGNGVDLLSGKISPTPPVLSIPAAPRLSLQRVQDVLPVLTGRLIPETFGHASYTINTGGSSSEAFDCGASGDCISKKRNGSYLIAVPQSGSLEYYEGGTGRLIHFDLRVGPQTPIVAGTEFVFYPSYIRYPSGEQITFTYNSYTDSNGHIHYRPATLQSLGFTLALSYEGNTGGQSGWFSVSLAKLYQSSSPSVTLAQHSYSGNTITDLAGREWTCGGCSNWLLGTTVGTTTSLVLPEETTSALASVGESRTYGTTTHSNWVTKVTRDGVDWNYTYVPGYQPQSTISKVTVTGPHSYSMVANIHVASNVRPRITSIVDSLGRTTSYQYDNDVRPTRITYPEGNWVEVTYDLLGNIIEKRQKAKAGSGLADIVETAQFNTYQHCYQPTCFRPQWTQDANGQQTAYSWDATTGDMLTKLEPVDASGQRRKTINSYSAGRLIRERVCLTNAAGVELTCGSADERVRDITYWGSTSLPLTETLTNGTGSVSLTTTYTYDAAGRQLSADGPLAGDDDATYNRYDVHGRRIWEIGPKGANALRKAKRFTYRNADDKVISVEEGTLPDPASTALAVHRRTNVGYDPRRNPSSEAVLGAGVTHTLTHRTFDTRNRLECEARRMNPGAFGSLPASACTLGTQGTFGPDRITRNIYDAAGQQTQVQRAYATPLQQNYATYLYSLNGKQTRVTDANGNRADLRYDGHDHLVRWVFPSKTTAGQVNETDYEAYTWDAAGNRTSLRKRDGVSITYAYDNLNRVTQKTVPTSASGAAGYSVFSGYDIGNAQLYARFGSASGAGITNTYDIFGRLVSSSNDMGGTARTLSYLYDAGSRRTRLTFPDGTYFSYEQDAANRLSTIRENGGTAVASFSYLGHGGLAGHWAPGFGSSYGYDEIQRLVGMLHDLAAPGADQTLTFAYNPASQIVTRTSANDNYASNTAVNVGRAYAVNGLNQYTSAGPASFTYDANGNLTSDGSTTMVYDAENRLVSASGAQTATLSYDPMGRLFQTSDGAPGTTQFLYDGDELVAEYHSTGAVARRYVHGIGTDDPILWYEGSDLSQRWSMMADHQGSIIGVANSSGSLIAINAYDAWGIPNATNQGRFQYTGQTWLPELGMYHYKARIYSPTLGRFLQTDPVGYEDQVNLYAYVANDPVNNTDSTGKAIDIFLDIAFVVADLADISSNGLNATNGVSLAANVIGAAIPGATGLGAGARSLMKLSPDTLKATQPRSALTQSRVDKMAKDMRKNGFDESKPVSVKEGPDGKRYLTDGHHRTDAAKKAGIDKIPAKIEKVDQKTAEGLKNDHMQAKCEDVTRCRW